MKLFNRAKFIGPIGLFVATAGGSAPAAEPAQRQQAPTHCEGMDEAQEKSDDKSTTGKATPEEKEARASEHEGPLALIGEGLSKICLSDDQRSAIEKLGKQVRPKEHDVSEARRALHSALADQLRSGKIDKSALDDEIDALVKARENASPVLRKALEDLHGLLDPGQRAALVDAIKSRIREVDDAAKTRWFDRLSKDLELSDDQKARVHEVLAKGKAQLEDDRRKGDAVLDAFKGEDFAMEKLVPLREVGKRVRARADGMVGVAKELSAILTPEQRAKLADRLERRMKHGHESDDRNATTEEQEDQAEGEEESTGKAKQEIVVARGGYRAGAVRGWGGGVGYARRTTVVRGGGYAVGYPFVGGYAPIIW